MNLPTYDELTLPMLRLLGDGAERSVSEVRQTLTEQLQLTPEQLEHRLPSGNQRTIDNRIGWAQTHLFKAGLLERRRRAVYAITPVGVEFLATNPTRITPRELSQFEAYRQFCSQTQREVPATDTDEEQAPVTPEEAIEQGMATLRADLESELLTRVQSLNPHGFEDLVLKLLHALGYGGSEADIQGVARGPDGGLDGVINEDKLGLDRIYIQAKRWASNVGRPEVQSFVGALAGVGAGKGVFITTAGFTAQAREYIETIKDRRIILVDGPRLVSLMIDAGIGVSVRQVYTVHRLDEDFFTDLE